MSNAVFAKYTTWVTGVVMVNKGEAWDSTDPIVTEHPDLFQDIPPEVRTSLPAEPGSNLPWGTRVNVEDATADPGRLRQLTPSKSSKAG